MKPRLILDETEFHVTSLMKRVSRNQFHWRYELFKLSSTLIICSYQKGFIMLNSSLAPVQPLTLSCRPNNSGCALPNDYLIIKIGDSILLLKLTSWPDLLAIFLTPQKKRLIHQNPLLNIPLIYAITIDCGISIRRLNQVNPVPVVSVLGWWLSGSLSGYW